MRKIIMFLAFVILLSFLAVCPATLQERTLVLFVILLSALLVARC